MRMELKVNDSIRKLREILARRMDQEEDRISGPQRFTTSQSGENK